MKMIFRSVGILLFIIAMAYGAFKQKQYSWVFLLLLTISLFNQASEDYGFDKD
jgi:hypothetical protein